MKKLFAVLATLLATFALDVAAQTGNPPQTSKPAAPPQDNLAGTRTGTVKWFNDKKGYGFIMPDAGGADVFVHFSAINMGGFKTLKQGQKVAYEVAKGPKGIAAQNVRAAP